MALSFVSMLLLVAQQRASASIYPVKKQYWIPPFQHAEKMFATNQGPVLSHAGKSSVTVRVSICCCRYADLYLSGLYMCNVTQTNSLTCVV